MAKRVPLDRTAVLRGALEIIDSEGLEALTMRRLGQHLDRNPMALYRHTASRAELLDGVVEQLFSALVVSDEVATWQEGLRATAHRFRAIARAHPRAVALLATRPLATPLGLRPFGTLRPLEQILALLEVAGFAPVDALHIYRSYFGLLLGHVLTELQEVVADPDETTALLRLGLHRLPAREFPRIRGLADELAGYDGEAELDQSVTVLLAGLSAQLRGEASP